MHGPVVAQQFLADRRPGLAQHAAARGGTVARPFIQQVLDGHRQSRLEFGHRQQQPGAVGRHQIAGATRLGRDHRHPGCQRLLDSLTERLVLACVHEDIHAGVGGGELRAVKRAGEHRRRQERLELVAVDAVPDNDQLQIVSTRKRGESLHLFLRCQPTDKPDNRLAVWRPMVT